MMEKIPQGLQNFIELMNADAHCNPLKMNLLPIWARYAVHRAYEIKRAGEAPIAFIKPRNDLSFDQILALTKIIRKTLQLEPIFDADELNPKFRSLFTRERIPFVHGEDIFAPKIIGRLSGLETLGRVFPETKATDLSSFSLKILAGALTRAIPADHLKVNEIHAEISRLGGHVATSKISVALRELKDLGFTTAYGRGPEKFYKLRDPNEALGLMLKLPHERLFKRMAYAIHPHGENFALAGESALAEYTNLASPKRKTIAMHRRDAKGAQATPHLPVFDEVEIEYWKENPMLFSIEKKLNPIELIFSVRPLMSDPRVQIEMRELLARFELALPEKEY
jgi:hypothetical protein